MPNKLPFLAIGPSKKHLITEDGKPFLWTGDTAWELFHRLDKNEVIQYLDDRSAKGFNVVQAVILAELDGLTVRNALGDLPLEDLDPTRPNERYFYFVDFVLEESEKRGIYIGLLPTWGDKYHKAWGVGPEIFTPENAFVYGQFLGRRYKDRSNLVWIMGGDRLPADEEDYRIVCQMAEGIRSGGSAHLMTMHPKGRHIASHIYGKESWLDVDMFQSLHLRGCKEYLFVRKAQKSRPQRPIINGEPGYENIPNCLGKWHKIRLDDFDVRRAAYWSMLSGAAGHTYGCNEIWQMHAPGRTAQHRANRSWKEALQLPGSAQIGFMRTFFERLPWQRLEPAQQIIGGFNLHTGAYQVAMCDSQGKFAIWYTPEGRTVNAKLHWATEPVVARWFDPAKGTYDPLKLELSGKRVKLTPPDKVVERNDWILLVMEQSFAASLGL